MRVAMGDKRLMKMIDITRALGLRAGSTQLLYLVRLLEHLLLTLPYIGDGGFIIIGDSSSGSARRVNIVTVPCPPPGAFAARAASRPARRDCPTYMDRGERKRDGSTPREREREAGGHY